MSNEDPLKNWQLEDRGEDQTQWKLQASEQGVNRNLQLQPADLPGPQWQPVEYQRVVRPRRNWVLPSIVIVALVGVLAYVGWVAFGRFGGGLNLGSFTAALPGALPPAESTPTVVPSPEEVAAAAVAPTAPPPTPVPVATATATPVATATATPEPSPTAAVAELVTGIVNVPDGVNARAEPATTGALVKLLTSGEQVTVVQEQAGWLQVILADNRVAWVAAEFLDRSSTPAPLEQINALLTAANLPPIGGAPAPLPGETAPALPPAVAEATAAPAATLSVTVLGDPGINARTLPTTEGVIMAAVPLNSILTAIGKSADGLWLAVQMADGQVGWVLAQFVAPAGDLATLAVVDPAALAAQLAAAATVTETVAPPAAATPAVAAPTPGGVTLPGTVSNQRGTNLRPAPDRNLDPILLANAGTVLTVLARTADNSWVQVQLADGALGWVLADTIAVEGDLTTLPAQP